MLLSGVRSSCDMLARNSDLYFEVSASSAALSSSARRACSISWFLRSTSTFCSASCCAFCAELLVGLLQFLLLRLQLAGELLRLLQQPFGLHRRLDAVEHDADARGQLFEEGQMRRRELVQRGEPDHRLDLPFEHDGKHDEVARQRLEEHRPDRNRVGRAHPRRECAACRARTGR